jgi:MFS family permease
VLGYSPLQVGIAFAPVTLIVLLASPLAGRLVTRFGARNLMLLGCALSGLGLLYLVGVDGDGSYIADVLPGLAAIALGNGLAFAPTMIAATHGLAEREHGLGSGLLNTSQELGSALGLGVLGALAAAAARLSGDELVAGYRVGFVAAAVLVALAVVTASRLPSAVGRTRAESAVTSGT